ncbi:tetratricopeptide repeat protein, partial [Parachitinimonas caeni]
NSLGEHRASLAEGDKALTALTKVANPDLQQKAHIQILKADSLRALTRLPEAKQQLAEVERSVWLKNALPSEALAHYWHVVGQVAYSEYRWQDVKRSEAKALEILEATPSPSPQLREQARYALAYSYLALRDLPTAEKQFIALKQSSEKRYGKVHFLHCQAIQGHAEILTIQFKLKEAIAEAQSATDCVQQAVGENTMAYAKALTRVANAHFSSADWEVAAGIYLRAAQIATKANGAIVSQALVYRNNAARAYKSAGQPEKAHPLLIAVLADARTTLPEDHAIVQSIKFHLAGTLLDMKKTEGVEKLLAGLKVATLNSIRPDKLWDAYLKYQHGRLAFYTGDKKVARQLLEEAARELNKDSRATIAQERQLANQLLAEASR